MVENAPLWQKQSEVILCPYPPPGLPPKHATHLPSPPYPAPTTSSFHVGLRSPPSRIHLEDTHPRKGHAVSGGRSESACPTPSPVRGDSLPAVSLGASSATLHNHSAERHRRRSQRWLVSPIAHHPVPQTPAFPPICFLRKSSISCRSSNLLK